jgi:hypothetical protein
MDEHEGSEDQRPPRRNGWVSYLIMAAVMVLFGVIVQEIWLRLVEFGLAAYAIVVAIVRFRSGRRRLHEQKDQERPSRDGWIRLLLLAGFMTLEAVLADNIWGRLLGLAGAAFGIIAAIFAFRLEWRWLEQHGGREE